MGKTLYEKVWDAHLVATRREKRRLFTSTVIWCTK